MPDFPDLTTRAKPYENRLGGVSTGHFYPHLNRKTQNFIAGLWSLRGLARFSVIAVLG